MAETVKFERDGTFSRVGDVEKVDIEQKKADEGMKSATKKPSTTKTTTTARTAKAGAKAKTSAAFDINSLRRGKTGSKAVALNVNGEEASEPAKKTSVESAGVQPSAEPAASTPVAKSATPKKKPEPKQKQSAEKTTTQASQSKTTATAQSKEETVVATTQSTMPKVNASATTTEKHSEVKELNLNSVTHTKSPIMHEQADKAVTSRIDEQKAEQHQSVVFPAQQTITQTKPVQPQQTTSSVEKLNLTGVENSVLSIPIVHPEAVGKSKIVSPRFSDCFTVVPLEDIAMKSGISVQSIKAWANRCLMQLLTTPAIIFCYKEQKDIRAYNVVLGTNNTYGVIVGYGTEMSCVLVEGSSGKVGRVSEITAQGPFLCHDGDVVVNIFSVKKIAREV